MATEAATALALKEILRSAFTDGGLGTLASNTVALDEPTICPLLWEKLDTLRARPGPGVLSTPLWHIRLPPEMVPASTQDRLPGSAVCSRLIFGTHTDIMQLYDAYQLAPSRRQTRSMPSTDDFGVMLPVGEPMLSRFRASLPLWECAYRKGSKPSDEVLANAMRMWSTGVVDTSHWASKFEVNSNPEAGAERRMDLMAVVALRALVVERDALGGHEYGIDEDDGVDEDDSRGYEQRPGSNVAAETALKSEFARAILVGVRSAQTAVNIFESNLAADADGADLREWQALLEESGAADIDDDPMLIDDYDSRVTPERWQDATVKVSDTRYAKFICRRIRAAAEFDAGGRAVHMWMKKLKGERKFSEFLLQKARAAHTEAKRVFTEFSQVSKGRTDMDTLRQIAALRSKRDSARNRLQRMTLQNRSGTSRADLKNRTKKHEATGIGLVLQKAMDRYEHRIELLELKQNNDDEQRWVPALLQLMQHTMRAIDAVLDKSKLVDKDMREGSIFRTLHTDLHKPVKEFLDGMESSRFDIRGAGMHEPDGVDNPAIKAEYDRLLGGMSATYRPERLPARRDDTIDGIYELVKTHVTALGESVVTPVTRNPDPPHEDLSISSLVSNDTTPTTIVSKHAAERDIDMAVHAHRKAWLEAWWEATQAQRDKNREIGSSGDSDGAVQELVQHMYLEGEKLRLSLAMRDLVYASTFDVVKIPAKRVKGEPAAGPTFTKTIDKEVDKDLLHALVTTTKPVLDWLASGGNVNGPNANEWRKYAEKVQLRIRDDTGGWFRRHHAISQADARADTAMEALKRASCGYIAGLPGDAGEENAESWTRRHKEFANILAWIEHKLYSRDLHTDYRDYTDYTLDDKIILEQAREYNAHFANLYEQAVTDSHPDATRMVIAPLRLNNERGLLTSKQGKPLLDSTESMVTSFRKQWGFATSPPQPNVAAKRVHEQAMPGGAKKRAKVARENAVARAELEGIDDPFEAGVFSPKELLAEMNTLAGKKSGRAKMYVDCLKSLLPDADADLDTRVQRGLKLTHKQELQDLFALWSSPRIDARGGEVPPVSVINQVNKQNVYLEGFRYKLAVKTIGNSKFSEIVVVPVKPGTIISRLRDGLANALGATPEATNQTQATVKLAEDKVQSMMDKSSHVIEWIRAGDEQGMEACAVDDRKNLLRSSEIKVGDRKARVVHAFLRANEGWRRLETLHVHSDKKLMLLGTYKPEPDLHTKLERLRDIRHPARIYAWLLLKAKRREAEFRGTEYRLWANTLNAVSTDLVERYTLAGNRMTSARPSQDIGDYVDANLKQAHMIVAKCIKFADMCNRRSTEFNARWLALGRDAGMSRSDLPNDADVHVTQKDAYEHELPAGELKTVMFRGEATEIVAFLNMLFSHPDMAWGDEFWKTAVTLLDKTVIAQVINAVSESISAMYRFPLLLTYPGQGDGGLAVHDPRFNPEYDDRLTFFTERIRPWLCALNMHPEMTRPNLLAKEHGTQLVIQYKIRARLDQQILPPCYAPNAKPFFGVEDPVLVILSAAGSMGGRVFRANWGPADTLADGAARQVTQVDDAFDAFKNGEKDDSVIRAYLQRAPPSTTPEDTNFNKFLASSDDIAKKLHARFVTMYIRVHVARATAGAPSAPDAPSGASSGALIFDTKQAAELMHAKMYDGDASGAYRVAAYQTPNSPQRLGYAVLTGDPPLTWKHDERHYTLKWVTPTSLSHIRPLASTAAAAGATAAAAAAADTPPISATAALQLELEEIDKLVSNLGWIAPLYRNGKRIQPKQLPDPHKW